jgi:thiamine-phosphate pyrophosphorylase
MALAIDRVTTTRFPLRIQGLYAVTPETADTKRLLQMVEAALDGGARVVQYRQKLADAALRLAQARALQKLLSAHGKPLIINDDVALAVESHADGVHLGRTDGEITVARARLGATRLIGVSCYNEFDRAVAAVAAGANYVAFGSMFASRVKPDAARADIGLITRAQKAFAASQVAVVAIGGITRHNTQQLIDAGVDAVAVISDLFDAPDIAACALSYQQLFENHVRAKPTTI